jgi:hypothetical protein
LIHTFACAANHLRSYWISRTRCREHDAERGRHVGQLVAAADEIHRLQVRIAGRADLAAVRLVRAVRHQVHAELALRRFDGGVDSPFRHVVAFGVELEVMDQRFHRALHLAALGRHDLAVGGRTGPLFLAQFSCSTHCFMIFTDWRISSMRIR